VHKRSCKVVWINSDHICELIETCTAVGDNTSDPGARLPVVNAVASAYDCVWNDLIGEAEARLEVAPVGYVVSALFRRGEDFPPLQGKVHGLAGNGVGIGQASTIQWTGGIRIKVILVIKAICARQRDVITQAQIQCKFGRDLPVILCKESVLVIRSGRPELDFFVGSTTIAGTALRHLAHHKARHGVAAAVVYSRWAGVRGICIEAEESDGSVGLDVVNLVNSAVKP